MRKLWLLFLVGLATGSISEKLLVSSQSSFSTADDLYLEGRPSGDAPVDDEDDQDGGSGSGSGDYDFIDLTEEEVIRRIHKGVSLPKEMVPTRPQSTADSSRSTPTTAAESQDQTTTVKTPPYIPDSNNGEQKVPGDLFTESTSPSSTKMPSRETTEIEFGMDISVTRESDLDNSLDRWTVATKDSGVEVLTKDFENEILAKDGRDSKLYELDSPEQVTTENMWEKTEVLAAVIACGVVGFLCAVFLLLLLAYRMKKKDEGSYDLGDTKLSTTAYHKAPTKEFYA